MYYTTNKSIKQYDEFFVALPDAQASFILIILANLNIILYAFQEIPEAPEGKTYRQLGTMESNIFSLIGCRMKRGRMSWSIKGGENLAKLLTLKSTDRLDSKIEFLASAVESQKIEKAEDVIFSAYRTPERVGKGYNGIPTSRIPDLPFVKPILEMKPLFGIK